MSDAVTTSLIGPRELLRRMRIKTFDAAKEVAKMASTLGVVSCKKGCDNCCHQKVLSTPAEGLPIFLYLQFKGLWSTELEDELAEADVHGTRTSHHDWFMERRPCPFLRKGECSVYPVRPVGCIATFSINHPDFCGMPDAKVPPGLGQMQINAPTAPAMQSLGMLLMGIEVGIPGAGYMTLPGAVLAGARHATLREPRRALVVDLGTGNPGLIEKFDEAGKTFDFEATT
jgi:hypothetical protein